MKTLCSLLCLTVALSCSPALAAEDAVGTETESSKTATSTPTTPETETPVAETPEASTPESTNSKTTTPKSSTPKVSKKQAQTTAMKLVPGKLLRWDLEIQEGNPSYTFYIKGTDGRISEVAIDGMTGEKDHIGIELEYGTKDGKGFKNTSAADRDRWKEAKFSKDQAQVKALAAHPGTVDAWELLIWKMGDKDKLVYEYRIADKGQRKVVCVDSMTGEILATSVFADGN